MGNICLRMGWGIRVNLKRDRDKVKGYWDIDKVDIIKANLKMIEKMVKG